MLGRGGASHLHPAFWRRPDGESEEDPTLDPMSQCGVTSFHRTTLNVDPANVHIVTELKKFKSLGSLKREERDKVRI